jgi:hypothetical protein
MAAAASPFGCKLVRRNTIGRFKPVGRPTVNGVGSATVVPGNSRVRRCGGTCDADDDRATRADAPGDDERFLLADAPDMRLLGILPAEASLEKYHEHLERPGRWVDQAEPPVQGLGDQ